MGLTLKKKTALCYNRALSKKAIDIAVLDLRGISDVADVFLIAGAASRVHAQAITNAIEKALRDAGEKSYHVEGYQNAKWTLIDIGDVIVHIFLKEAREYYDMERLWTDATQFKVDAVA